MRQLVPFQASATVRMLMPSAWRPAAMQALREGHDTPARTVPPGLGITWSVQRAPFHRSAKSAPTAVQAPGELHETAESPPLVAPAGLGVAWMRHLVPFQASASVRPLPRMTELPTAVQAR